MMLKMVMIIMIKMMIMMYDYDGWWMMRNTGEIRWYPCRQQKAKNNLLTPEIAATYGPADRSMSAQSKTEWKNR